MNAAVEVDADSEVWAHSLADGCDVGEHGIDLVERVDELQFLGGVHLHRGEPPGRPLLGLGRRLAGAVAADPGVDTDSIADLSAQ